MLAAFTHADFLTFRGNHKFDKLTRRLFLHTALHHKDRGALGEGGLTFRPHHRNHFKVVFTRVFIEQRDMVRAAEEHAALPGTEGGNNVGGGGVNRARLGDFVAHHGAHKGHRLSHFRRIERSAEFSALFFNEIAARLPDKATHKPAGVAARRGGGNDKSVGIIFAVAIGILGGEGFCQGLNIIPALRLRQPQFFPPVFAHKQGESLRGGRYAIVFTVDIAGALPCRLE